MSAPDSAPRIRIGELLVQQGVLTEDKLADALRIQKEEGGKRRLGRVLIDHGFVDETHLTQVLGRQLSVPWVSLYHVDFSRQLLNLVPREVAEGYGLIPVYVRNVRGQGDTLYVATDDPTNEEGLRRVGAYAGLPVRAMIASASDIRAAIRVYYGASPAPVVKGPAVEIAPASTRSPMPAIEIPEATPAETVPAQTAPAATVPASTKPEQTPAVSLPDGFATTKPDLGRPAPADPHPSEPIALTSRSRPPIAADPKPEPESESEGESVAVPSIAAVEITRAAPAPEAPKPAAVAEVPKPVAVAAAVAEAPRPVATPARSEPKPERSEPKSDPPPHRPRRPAIALTFLDGTTIKLPAPRAARTRKPLPEAPESEPEPAADDPLTARDLVSALRAVSHGADASEILGENPRWEAMFAALLSLLLKKHLIADWEFVEEFRKI